MPRGAPQGEKQNARKARAPLPSVKTDPDFWSNVAEGFWPQVDKVLCGECWNWKGSMARSGYGLFMMPDKSSRVAHRIAYTLRCGDIPEGLIIRHMCDNKACCNPAHLRAGTHADNAADRRGMRSPMIGSKHFRKNYPKSSSIKIGISSFINHNKWSIENAAAIMGIREDILDRIYAECEVVSVDDMQSLREAIEGRIKTLNRILEVIQ